MITLIMSFGMAAGIFLGWLVVRRAGRPLDHDKTKDE